MEGLIGSCSVMSFLLSSRSLSDASILTSRQYLQCRPLFQSLVAKVKSIIVKFILAVNLSGMTVVCLFLAQGPCTGNQQSLAHSRLWDAVVGFLHVFAHMQMKLSQVKSLSSVSLWETLYTVIIGKLNTFPCQNIVFLR